MKVGVLLVTRERMPDDTLITVAHLQQRGEWDYKLGQPQTWERVCQVTAEGKLKRTEVPFSCALREANEELGPKVGQWVMIKMLEKSNLPQQILFQDKNVITFGLVVPSYVLEWVRLEPISGGLIRVKEDDKLRIAKDDMRTVPHRSHMPVVFPPVIAALKAAFDKFRSVQ